MARPYHALLSLNKSACHDGDVESMLRTRVLIHKLIVMMMMMMITMMIADVEEASA